MALFDDTRPTWAARKPKQAGTYVAPARRTEFFNHYDGGTPIIVNGHDDCLARVLHDQAFHMDSNGWSDIGYNGLVCQHGRAIEGRGIDFVGAHCPNHNTSGYGFQFMVGGNQAPTDAAKARMRQLYDDCSARSGHALAKKGHRDGFATACPGDLIQSWVKAGMPSPTKPQAIPPAITKEAGLAAEDAQKVIDELEDHINKVLLRGYQDGGKAKPSLLAILVETQRRVTVAANATNPESIAAAVAAGIKASGSDINVNDLAKAIVVELGKA